MKNLTEFPFEIEVKDPVFITLKDGVKLAARVWLPKTPANFRYLQYLNIYPTEDKTVLLIAML